MDDGEFLRKLRKCARRHGLSVVENRKRGKGSHRTVYFGDRKTVLAKGELPQGTLRAMLKQLGLTMKDLA